MEQQQYKKGKNLKSEGKIRIRKISCSVFFLFILCLIGFWAFHSHPSYVIELPTGDSTPSIKSYMKDLEDIPAVLISPLEKLVFTNQDIYEKAGIEGQDIGNTYGLTVPGVIYLKSDKYQSGILLHEFGHLFDFSFSNPPSQSKEFKALLSSYQSILDESLNFPDYARTNTYEYFAECIRWYYEFPDQLSNICPGIYSYIDSTIKKDST